MVGGLLRVLRNGLPNPLTNVVGDRRSLANRKHESGADAERFPLGPLVCELDPKRDVATSLEVFGSYIHTYKFSEAVEDKVVLDLVYEARDIDQAVQLLTGSLRERAARYLDKWARWGDHLRLASRVAAPILHHFFGSIQAEAEESLEKARP